MTESTEFISAEQLLGGLPARRASTLLFAIESRTAGLVAQARQIAEPYLRPQAAAEQEQEFLAALAEGRDQRQAIRIQEMERHAPEWAVLVPDDASARAAILQLMGQKYPFARQEVPKLRKALGADTQPVRSAFERLYGTSLDSIYTIQGTFTNRLRWMWMQLSARLEALPPFWLAFFLTTSNAAGLLALPIALAPMGFDRALAITLFFGLVSLLTTLALAEVVARSGISRFGLGYLGQLAQEYLGRQASFLVTAFSAVNSFLVLMVFFLGFSSALESASHLPAEIWVGVLLAVCLYFLSRRSLNTTVAATLLCVFLNLFALIAIPLICLPYFRATNLAASMSVRGQPFTWTSAGIVMGILFSTFLPHFLVVTYGPVVLKRDPGGRAWIWGTAASLGAFILIACLWLVVTNGVLSPEVLASAPGTVLSPLADRVGLAASVLGSIVVIFSLGLTAIQIALTLYYVVIERLPKSGPSVLSRLSEKSRFLLAVSPIIPAFLLVEWILFTGSSSFAGLMSIQGALALPFLTGVLPVGLLAATRSKSDFVPSIVPSWLGHPVLLWLLYLLFVGSIFAHGLLIWQDFLPRISAVICGLFILGVTVSVWRQNLFSTRAVFELRHDESLAGMNSLTLTTAGRALPAEICLTYDGDEKRLQTAQAEIPLYARLRLLNFRLPASQARQIKVWAHHITPEGRSEGMPVKVQMCTEERSQEFELTTANGILIVEIPSQNCQFGVRLP